MKVKEWLLHSKLFKRALLLVIVSSMIFCDALPAFGVEVEKASSTVNFWRWDRYDKLQKGKNEYNRALLYKDGYASVNVTYNDKRIYFNTVSNPNVSFGDSFFITTTDLGAMGLSNDGGGRMGNEWIFYYPGTSVEVASCDDSDMTFRWGGGWEDSDHGYCFDDRGNGWVGILHRAKSKAFDWHYNNGWYSYGNKVECESCGNADDHKEPSFLCYFGRQIVFSAITADRLTITKGSVLNINDEVVLQSTDNSKLASIYIEEGGVMTVEGRFYFNGWIENHGTIIINDGASMMPYDPPGPNGKLCDIVVDGGDLIVMNGATLVLKDTSGTIQLKNGASLVNNGRIVLPHGFTNSDSTIYNREGAYLWVGYKMASGMSNLSTKATTGSGSSYYIPGMSAVSSGTYASYDAGDDVTSFLKNDGYVRIARSDMINYTGTGHDATSDGSEVQTNKTEIDKQRKAWYNTNTMSKDSFKEVMTKTMNDAKTAMDSAYNAYIQAQNQYTINSKETYKKARDDAEAVYNAKEKEYNAAKAVVDNIDTYYKTYQRDQWQKALEQYPYSNTASYGSATIG